MKNDFTDLDSEIAALLDGIGYDPSTDIDDSTTIKRNPVNLESDFDGTPIIGTVKKGKEQKPQKEIKEKEVVKSAGRGRPQNKTINFDQYSTVHQKLGVLFGALYSKYGQETITLLQHQKLIEIVILDNDGESACERIRMYVGQIDPKAHGRDKCKGRHNVYERKGVFPIIELNNAVADTIARFLKK